MQVCSVSISVPWNVQHNWWYKFQVVQVVVIKKVMYIYRHYSNMLLKRCISIA